MKERPYWHDTLDIPSSEPATLPARADVAIVGAGYTGLAAARELAKRGASVVVMDREHVGWGASSRNGGQVLTGLKLDAAALIDTFGETGARELYEVSLDAIAALEGLIAEERLDCEYVRSGHVDAANKPSQFESFRSDQALLARVFSHPVHLISPAEQRSEIGSAIYHGLMLDERSGSLNPAKYVHQLARSARRAGAVIADGAGVEAISRDPAGWTVSSSRGSVAAGDVLIATNGYTGRVTPWLQRRLVPIGSHIIATAPMDAGVAASLIPKRRMVFDANYFLHYYRVTTDNRLLFGGRAVFGRTTADTTRRCAEILRRDMLAVFPQIGSTPVDYAWSGNVAFSRDQLPHAGRHDGLYYSAGYCGHGVAMGTYLGAVIARRMSGDSQRHPLVDREFPAVPLYRGTPWFLPFAGAYYKLLDWLA